MKTIILAAIATLGIVFQNIFEMHGWIFYLTFTAYLLLVKDTKGAIKLSYSFLLGIVLSILIWEMTGLLKGWTGSLGIGMSIAAFIGICAVLFVRKMATLNMSAAFFFGLIAYYGLAKPPSVEVVMEIIIPALLGIAVAFGYVYLEKQIETSKKEA
ncbi:DUF1097 domain-containing protein [Aquimarina gracilis]|uniref:DUF1097 domain-containing protein n=1 Tax=Aquimarina gracilis TaxID=874422 RepID=A0ABU5ZT18_9FLAO|nr:DUF1097 domain-containing protein [Aquimarina gracilis]MEB3345109.1 DUF1097 domain-containing protein [Aquimarina gracilis]